MSYFDYNTAEKQQGSLIPEGSIVPLQLKIRPKGASFAGMGPNDAGLFKETNDGTAYMIDVEYTVLGGEFAKRPGWEMICAKGNGSEGHNVWENIARTKIRAILESSRNIDPKDDGPEAMAKRQIQGFMDLQGISFTAIVGIESQEGYDDKNTFKPVTPDMDGYRQAPEGAPIATVAPAAQVAAQTQTATAAAGMGDW